MVKFLLSKGARFDKKDIIAAERENTKIKSILEDWPLTMTLATLQSDDMVYNVYNHTDAGDMINLKDYLGKEGTDFGGRRRRTNKRKTRTIKRKSNKRRRTNRRRNSRKSRK